MTFAVAVYFYCLLLLPLLCNVNISTIEVTCSAIPSHLIVELGDRRSSDERATQPIGWNAERHHVE